LNIWLLLVVEEVALYMVEVVVLVDLEQELGFL
jgi:hypothetical protein